MYENREGRGGNGGGAGGGLGGRSWTAVGNFVAAAWGSEGGGCGGSGRGCDRLAMAFATVLGLHHLVSRKLQHQSLPIPVRGSGSEQGDGASRTVPRICWKNSLVDLCTAEIRLAAVVINSGEVHNCRGKIQQTRDFSGEIRGHQQPFLMYFYQARAITRRLRKTVREGLD